MICTDCNGPMVLVQIGQGRFVCPGCTVRRVEKLESQKAVTEADCDTEHLARLKAEEDHASALASFNAQNENAKRLAKRLEAVEGSLFDLLSDVNAFLLAGGPENRQALDTARLHAKKLLKASEVRNG